jgi:AraC-like DNA-binding protein
MAAAVTTMTRPATSTRGVLHPRVSREHYSLARFPAGPGLDHLVQHLWVVEWDLAEPFTAHVLPHPNVNLCVMASRSRISGTGRKVFLQRLEGAGRVVGVTFRPGAFRLLHDAPARSLTDRELPVRAVYDVDVAALERAVLPVEVPDALARMEELLRTRIPPPEAQARLAGEIVDTVVADRSLGRVQHVAVRFDLPVWRLQRLFAEHVGVTPKWVLMRARLHDATDAVAEEGQPDWARLAAELGYCDQAHLIRAFKAAIGTTPAEYVRRSRAGS